MTQTRRLAVVAILLASAGQALAQLPPPIVQILGFGESVGGAPGWVKALIDCGAVDPSTIMAVEAYASNSVHVTELTLTDLAVVALAGEQVPAAASFEATFALTPENPGQSVKAIHDQIVHFGFRYQVNSDGLVALAGLVGGGKVDPTSEWSKIGEDHRTCDFVNPSTTLVTLLGESAATLSGTFLEPNDGSGIPVQTFEVLYSTSPLNGNGSTWASTATVALTYVGAHPGLPVNFVIPNLQPQTTYHVAVRAYDEFLNVGDPVQATPGVTLAGPPPLPESSSGTSSCGGSATGTALLLVVLPFAMAAGRLR